MLMHRRRQTMHLAMKDAAFDWKTGLMENPGRKVMSIDEVLKSLGWNKNPLHLSVPDLVAICQQCRKEKHLPSAKSLHMHIRTSGLLEDLGNYIVPVLVECGSLCDAQRVFNDLLDRNEFSWCSLLKGYLDQGDLHYVFDLFEKMHDNGVRQSRHSILIPLKACSRLRSIEKGHYVHSVIFKEGLEDDIVIGNTLVDMYAKCGLLLEALDVFDKLKGRDVVSWNALITGYIEQGLIEDALKSLEKMQMESVISDSVTLLCMLKVFCSKDSIDGLYVHDTAVKQGLEGGRFIGNALVDMYIKCGMPAEARKIIDQLPSRDVVAWTALIAGYVDHGFGEEALICFEQMQEDTITPNAATFLCSLKACSITGNVVKGRAIHADIPIELLKMDASLGNSLIDMYAKCGAINEAQQVFEQLPLRNNISWNALLAGYTEHGYGDDALNYFGKMQREGYSPDSSSLNCGLKACGIIGSLTQSQEMHDMIVRKGLEKASFIGNTLVDVYAKCGLLAEAQKLFDELLLQTVVSWTALIAGYSDHGQSREALNCFDQMQLEGVAPNSVTSACCLKACTNMGDIERGHEIHSEVTKRGVLLVDFSGKGHCARFDTNRMRLGNALIDMYGKCGNILSAQKVFNEMPAHDLVTWNALITSHSRQGHSELVFNIFNEMKKEGVDPDGITFLSLLSVCSHAGLVNKAQSYFETMTIRFKISPTIEHYNCMVDILSRAGQLKEAISMLNKMPYQPSIVAWCSILSACRKWHNVKLGRYAFDCIVKLEKEHAPAFILMFNIYVDAHMWDEASKIETMMSTWKNQGQAWIEIAGIVHCFTINDANCVQDNELFIKLQEIKQKMGCPVMDVTYPVTDVKVKDSLSCGHTEMLAAVFGLLNTLEGTPINIKKNLHVCADCHATMEFMSKSERRIIICKDPSYFHKFKEGKCSCECKYPSDIKAEGTHIK